MCILADDCMALSIHGVMYFLCTCRRLCQVLLDDFGDLRLTFPLSGARYEVLETAESRLEQFGTIKDCTPCAGTS